LVKSQRIRALLNDKLALDKIAKEVNTSIGYVRNIKHDLGKGGGTVKRLRSDMRDWKLRKTEKRNGQRQRYYQKGYKTIRRRAWSGNEINMIMGSFIGTDRELSFKIIHSVKAIQVKRVSILKQRLRGFCNE